MSGSRAAILLFLMLLSAALSAEEKIAAPALDAAKYPQGTPEEALTSIVKALDSRDLTYWVGNLILPTDTKRLVEKHGSVEKVAENNADPARAERMKVQSAVMKKMLETKKMTEGETDGVKWARYHDEEKILQLEKQPDGRWCMNIRVSTTRPKNPDAKKDEVKKD